MTDRKENARRFFEDILGTGDWSQAREVLAETVVMHHPAAPGPVEGLEAVQQALAPFRDAFPDLRLRVHDLVEEGDKVAVRWSAQGTNNGSLFGIPATGKAATVGGVSFLRFEGDRIAEDWVQEDTFGMMVQLGLAPAPA